MQKRQQKNKITYFSFLLLIILVIFNPVLYAFSNVTINGVFYSLEEAKTPQERSKGLMFRTSMPNNHGMIFIYDKETIISIWMKNTYIPLDIIWINKQNQIIDIQTGTPESEKIHFPLGFAKYVIELNKGQAEKIKATIGTKVLLK